MANAPSQNAAQGMTWDSIKKQTTEIVMRELGFDAPPADGASSTAPTQRSKTTTTKIAESQSSVVKSRNGKAQAYLAARRTNRTPDATRHYPHEHPIPSHSPAKSCGT
ncbi:hypothetical protein Q7P37_002218 [Cladosporium fusiforme]